MKKEFEMPEINVVILEVKDIILYSLEEDELPPF